MKKLRLRLRLLKQLQKKHLSSHHNHGQLKVIWAALIYKTMSEGIKYDNDKPEYGLLPPHALEEVAKVLTFGAKKYDRENWKKLDDLQRRYFDAAQRHLWALKRSEKHDPESGLHHAAHALACLLFYLESELNVDIITK